jgi:hypothetical protein
MEQWFVERACDGFVISPTHVPGGYEDFVRQVVPELQRRGVFRKEYEGATLRENLALPNPDAGDWRNQAFAGVNAKPLRKAAQGRPVLGCCE